MKATLIKAAWIAGGILAGVFVKGYLDGNKAKANAAATIGA